MADNVMSYRSIRIEEFLPLVGKTMLADCTPSVAELDLVTLNRYEPQHSSRIPFTLIFRSSAEIQLIAGMYPLRCGTFGPDIVYLEPTLPPRDAAPGNYYQAVFN